MVLDLANAADSFALGPRRSAGGGQWMFTSLLHLIEAGERGLEMAQVLNERFAGSGEPGVEVPVSSVRLRAPFPGQRFALGGANSAVHVANLLTHFGQPTTADEIYERSRSRLAGGFWVVSPPVGPGARIEIPTRSKGLFDYEGEVAVVLGGGGKRLKADRWNEAIWGTTHVIDWSIRTDGTTESRQPFYTHKIFDGSKSMGPYISVGEVDPYDIEVETLVNGQVRQTFNTGDLIYSFGELLEHLSQDLTLLAGDVLSGGTGAGTAYDMSVPDANGHMPLDLFLKAGDEVEVRSTALGSLPARIVASD